MSQCSNYCSFGKKILQRHHLYQPHIRRWSKLGSQHRSFRVLNVRFPSEQENIGGNLVPCLLIRYNVASKFECLLIWSTFRRNTLHRRAFIRMKRLGSHFFLDVSNLVWLVSLQIVLWASFPHWASESKFRPHRKLNQFLFYPKIRCS